MAGHLVGLQHGRSLERSILLRLGCLSRKCSKAGEHCVLYVMEFFLSGMDNYCDLLIT